MHVIAVKEMQNTQFFPHTIHHACHFRTALHFISCSLLNTTHRVSDRIAHSQCGNANKYWPLFEFSHSPCCLETMDATFVVVVEILNIILLLLFERKEKIFTNENGWGARACVCAVCMSPLRQNGSSGRSTVDSMNHTTYPHDG